MGENSLKDLIKSISNNTKKRRERCPKGTRRNLKTGVCEPFRKKSKASDAGDTGDAGDAGDAGESINTEPSIQEVTKMADPTSLPELSIILENTLTEPTDKRCPRGTRRSKKTGLCEEVKKKKTGVDSEYDIPFVPLPITSKDIREYNRLRGLEVEVVPSNDDSPIRLIPLTQREEEKTKNKKSARGRKTIKRKEPSKINEEALSSPSIPQSSSMEEEYVEPTSILPTKAQAKKRRKIVIDTQEKRAELEAIVPVAINPTEPQNVTDTLKHLDPESNDFLLEKEKIEHKSALKEDEYDFLYPDLNDPNFNIKIYRHKEFNDTRYDGTIYEIKEQAEKMCSAEFELLPHQLFVKNFLSFQTPYNSLLLYHGLGTGKTCSAIGISEEMRQYMKQVGIKQRIIVVASPNVQANFRLQLFDEKKLVKDGEIWKIQSCVGNALLKEINPTSMSGLSKDKIISNIKSIIKQSYLFMGYVEFANYISNHTAVSAESGYSDQEKRAMKIQNIKRVFNNQLIVIDEVHNIRISEENKNKRIAMQLFELAKHADNLRFLFLSATPMYNTYKEIIWLTNLMNVNDGRGQIEISDVFSKTGEFLEKTDKRPESGDALLRRKLTGYVSYIRGENPYTFPYRIYPDTFSPDHTFIHGATEKDIGPRLVYPTIQLNGKAIETPLRHVQLYVSKLGKYQEAGYSYIVNSMRHQKSGTDVDVDKLPNFENMDSFGYTMLQIPLESLNIVYPNPHIDKIMVERGGSLEYDRDKIAAMVGKQGLAHIMKYTDHSNRNPPERYGFEYKPAVLEKYGRIFSQEHLAKYSNKISEICRAILTSEGIILIYSEYIDGGVVPIALALEELGFHRFGTANYTKSLFKTPHRDPLDAVTRLNRSKLTPEQASDFQQAHYMMITGDRAFSANNAEDIKYATDPANKDGHKVKVILISKSGAEGLDFKNIRHVHIMEPWYNMSRIEQIIGRGVRNLSHCRLPFEKRNVALFLHGSLMSERPDEECADLYVYRVAEKKAIQIGRVTRVLKENAVDCLLHLGQTNFTVAKLNEIAANQEIIIELTDGTKMPYRIGDRKFTDICDYMNNCEFTCSPTAPAILPDKDIIRDTYNTIALNTNQDRIAERIRALFKEQHFFLREQLVAAVNITRPYPIEQIYSVLTKFVKNKNEILVDQYGRAGTLIDKSIVDKETEKSLTYYAFQPLEITDQNASIYERSAPVDYKHERLAMEIPKELPKRSEIANLKRSVAPEQNDVYLKEQYDLLINAFEEHLEYVYTARSIPGAEREWDWYMHARKIFPHISAIYNIPDPIMYKYVIYHILDSLKFNEKMVFIQTLYSGFWTPDNSTDQRHELESSIKAYFDERIMTENRKRGVFLNKDNSGKLFIQDDADPAEWKEAEPQDINKFAPSISKMIVPISRLSDRVGFMSLFKNQDMVFYVKDMHNERNSGARCDSAGKTRIIEFLNHILGRSIYSQENTKTISHMGLCVILEMVMRHKTDETEGKRHWYITPEQAVLIKIKEIAILDK